MDTVSHVPELEGRTHAKMFAFALEDVHGPCWPCGEVGQESQKKVDLDSQQFLVLRRVALSDGWRRLAIWAVL
jgi:hypothetical protein